MSERGHPCSIMYMDSCSAIAAVSEYGSANCFVAQILLSFHKLYMEGLSVENFWVPAFS